MFQGLYYGGPNWALFQFQNPGWPRAGGWQRAGKTRSLGTELAFVFFTVMRCRLGHFLDCKFLWRAAPFPVWIIYPPPPPLKCFQLPQQLSVRSAPQLPLLPSEVSHWGETHRRGPLVLLPLFV